jgi:hypothetical protein
MMAQFAKECPPVLLVNREYCYAASVLQERGYFAWHSTAHENTFVREFMRR